MLTLHAEGDSFNDRHGSLFRGDISMSTPAARFPRSAGLESTGGGRIEHEEHARGQSDGQLGIGRLNRLANRSGLLRGALHRRHADAAPHSPRTAWEDQVAAGVFMWVAGSFAFMLPTIVLAVQSPSTRSTQAALGTV